MSRCPGCDNKIHCARCDGDDDEEPKATAWTAEDRAKATEQRERDDAPGREFEVMPSSLLPAVPYPARAEAPHSAGRVARVTMMAKGDPAWDLSPNDRAAIRHVLDRMRAAEAK